VRYCTTAFSHGRGEKALPGHIVFMIATSMDRQLLRAPLQSQPDFEMPDYGDVLE